MQSWPHLNLALIPHQPDPAREQLALRFAAGSGVSDQRKPAMHWESAEVVDRRVGADA